MKTRLKPEIDYRTLLKREMGKRGSKIMSRALCHYGYHLEKVDLEKIQVRMENVKNYSVPIFTVRYEGNLLFRRFPNGLSGLEFRYESPIFNNVNS